jgi:hypothetical protein
MYESSTESLPIIHTELISQKQHILRSQTYTSGSPNLTPYANKLDTDHSKHKKRNRQNANLRPDCYVYCDLYRMRYGTCTVATVFAAFILLVLIFLLGLAAVITWSIDPQFFYNLTH